MESGHSTDALPLIALQPVVDAQQGWVAMLLRAEPLPDEAAQRRLFDAAGLADALDGLPCIVPAFGRAVDAPAGGFIHPIPALTATDPAAPAGAAPPECGSGPCLALGVDSFSAFERCRKAGFTWFAGNYALRPMPGMAARNATRHALVLQLLTLIARDADAREMETLIKQDPQLSYQLLRLVNSVAYAPGQRIAGFNQAITMLGRKPMQRWLQLLLYARPDGSDKNALLPRAAMRAALMEALVPADDAALREQAFMVGMFSLLEVLLNEPMAKLLAPLHLSVEVNRALMERGGALGPALRAVEAGDTGEAPLANALAAAGIAHDAWSRALVQACHWAVRVSREA
jgi:c-di-GMP phosphodiesterase